MRHRVLALRRILAAIIIAVALVVPTLEMFDQWDHTPADGTDTEANVVIVALCIGIAFTIGTVAVTRCIQSVADAFAGPVCAPALVIRELVYPLPPIPASSPPLALRV